MAGPIQNNLLPDTADISSGELIRTCGRIWYTTFCL